MSLMPPETWASQNLPVNYNKEGDIELKSCVSETIQMLYLYREKGTNTINIGDLISSNCKDMVQE